MKSLVIAILMLLPAAARAETFAFVDPARVDAESTEWGRLWGEVQADGETKQREVQAALSAAQKAKPAEAQALADKYRKLAKMDQDDLSAHQKTARVAFEKHRAEVAAALEREKHVTILLAPVAVPKPGRDLTDELIKRLNASDTQGIAEENAKLKARNAALEAAAKFEAPPKTAPPVAHK